MSSVAAVVDTKGGIRVVITERWRMRFHLSPGEKLFVVPGLKVQEPIPLADIPVLVEQAMRQVRVK